MLYEQDDLVRPLNRIYEGSVLVALSFLGYPVFP